MVNFTLDNIEEYEREFKGDFYLPPREIRQNLKGGDEVKFGYENILEIYQD